MAPISFLAVALQALRMLPALSGASASAAEDPGRPPSIIYILADDLGWTDLGCTGSKYYETPSIDRLAAEGMKFTSFYVCQNCAPTRASLLSGQYAPRTGIYTVGTLERGRGRDRKMALPRNVTALPLDRITVADALRSAGYATAHFGKWHLGDDDAHHPSRRGFDEAIVAEGRHFGFKTAPPVAVPEGAYLADFLTDRAVEFIERNRSRPFFLYLAHFAVHAPHQAKPELIARYEGRPPAGGHRSPVYAAMIASLDRSVGRVVSKLEELGIARSAVVIFSSDNGGVGGYDTTEGPSPRQGITDNAPLRGGKGTLYEGGIRVPFLVRWPGVVKPGSTTDAPAAHVDIFPTLIEMAGAKDRPQQALDGVSLVTLLRGGPPPARDAIFWHFPGYLESYVRETGWRTAPVGVIRCGDLKLLEFFEDGRLELYDVRRDIGETKDLAAELPDRVVDLRGKLSAWRASIGAAMPVPRKPGAAPGAEAAGPSGQGATAP